MNQLSEQAVRKFTRGMERLRAAINGEPDTMTMTQYAPVCGVQMYEQMAIRGILPNYHLLLAHDIVKPGRSARYKDVFQSLQRHRHATIILDNSVTELGTAVDLDIVGDAAAIVQANVIVLPDVYEDAQATVSQIEGCYLNWVDYFDGLLGHDNYSFMAVPQGKTIQEYAWCVERLAGFGNNAHMQKTHWWGIARNLVKHLGTRRDALKICATIDPTKAIHMLGFSDNVVDDILTVHNSDNIFVRGIDSAVPMRCSIIGRQFSLGLEEMPKRDPNWLETAVLTEAVQRDWDYASQLVSHLR